MKDSGVEWIGEIPNHWETSRLKNNSGFAKLRVFDKTSEEVIQCNSC